MSPILVNMLAWSEVWRLLYRYCVIYGKKHKMLDPSIYVRCLTKPMLDKVWVKKSQFAEIKFSSYISYFIFTICFWNLCFALLLQTKKMKYETIGVPRILQKCKTIFFYSDFWLKCQHNISLHLILFTK